MESVATPTLLLAWGAPNRLARAIAAAPRPLRTPAFIAGWSVIEAALRLPLHLYGGYALDRRYGLSNQTLRGWFTDRALSLGLSLGFGVPAGAVAFTLLRRAPRRWWVAVAAAVPPLSLLAAGLFPVLVAPLFNRYTRLDDAALAGRVTALAEREGLRVSEVVRMDMSRRTVRANAFFEGAGRTRRIVLSDTLLASFSPDEVLVVVAHELAHQVHRDTVRLTGALTLAVALGGFALSRLLPPLAARAAPYTGTSDPADPRTLPLLELALATAELGGTPLLAAYIRRRERAADRYAIRVTNDPAAFAGAMRRLLEMNLLEADPPPLARLLSSHPSIGSRIRMAERLQRDAGDTDSAE